MNPDSDYGNVTCDTGVYFHQVTCALWGFLGTPSVLSSNNKWGQFEESTSAPHTYCHESQQLAVIGYKIS